MEIFLAWLFGLNLPSGDSNFDLAGRQLESTSYAFCGQSIVLRQTGPIGNVATGPGLLA